MVTIKDVAARAGVPEKTAMRALSGMTMGKRRDARERLERVMKAAAELGYQPSEIAKALRKGRTRTIGLLVGSITNRYFASLAETVMDEAEQHGYRMILELTRWNVEKSIFCLEHLQRSRVDGIFYASGHFPEERPCLEKLRFRSRFKVSPEKASAMQHFPYGTAGRRRMKSSWSCSGTPAANTALPPLCTIRIRWTTWMRWRTPLPRR